MQSSVKIFACSSPIPPFLNLRFIFLVTKA
jgi:hypothetical protein